MIPLTGTDSVWATSTNRPETGRVDTTSASLLERLQLSADQAAWSRFVDLYTPLIYSWARQLGLQEADSADLVQEVFALLVEKMPSFVYDRRRSFRAWLRTVTLNKYRDRCRRRAARPAELTGQPPPEVPDQAVWPSAGEAEDTQRLVARALELMQAEFAPTTWKACWEFVVAGRPAAEVAAQLGISENAVHLAKGRVLRRLRRELQGLLDD
jgi:RNA polymerase sigma-70 factor (ECF subfamily)